MLEREAAQPTHVHRDSVPRPAADRTIRGLREATDASVRHRPPAVVADVAAVLARGSGRPLHPGARAELEPLVGRDLADVRVHDDTVAARSAHAAGARAYTAGTDIVFGPGRYAPETDEGRAL